ncbi:MAG: hypothetical protein DHS20C08_02090 [Rhodomicrobium sp.]|nr:MAG: hypothetical protein DHS20C08_02090 [Rhodomicrobium sp.]
MDDVFKEKIAHKIRALMAKAEDSAATEAEAIAAAAKAKELLDKYQLDLGSVALVREGFQQLRASDHSDESTEIHDQLAYFISQYTDTIAWHANNGPNTRSECRYFGLKSDVVFAVWLSQSLEKFVLRKAAPQREHGDEYYNSYRDGLINGINIKLQSAIQKNRKSRPPMGFNPEPEPESEQDRYAPPSNAPLNAGLSMAPRDKIGIVKTEAQKRFKFTGTKKSTSHNQNLGAFMTGRAEGKTANLNEPLADESEGTQLATDK